MAPTTPAPRVRALLLPVGGDLYAIALEQVREVVAAPKVTRLPTAPANVLGVFSLRGELVPVLDTGSLLSVHPLGAAPWCAVVETPLGPCALAADGLPRAGDLGPQEGPSSSAAGLGTYGTGNRLATLVDLVALVAPERLA